MEKYQIIEVSNNFNHAGSKAVADISKIASNMGYKPVYIHMLSTEISKIAKLQRQLGYFVDWNKCYREISEGAIVLLQHPFHHKQLTRQKILKKLKDKKHVKYISMIHDVEELRGFRYNDYYKREFDFMLQIADVFIVHNEFMKNFFEKKGVPKEKLIVLQVFDYLHSIRENKNILFERSISIAGNLDAQKCGYINQLGDIGVKVKLFGPNYEHGLDIYDNVEYQGQFSPDQIPLKLTEGFGLVWDGECIDSCAGQAGQYLCYNNPHKLSLYLSSGIPVVIWNKAAEADFVRKNHLGICVGSLLELKTIFENMNESIYKTYTSAVMSIGERIRKGEYGTKAITLAEEQVK